jgi:hypothetical protein
VIATLIHIECPLCEAEIDLDEVAFREDPDFRCTECGATAAWAPGPFRAVRSHGLGGAGGGMILVPAEKGERSWR